MSMTKKHIRAAKKLVKRYQEITLEEINEIHDHNTMRYKAWFLTGYGDADKCKLCLTANSCSKCIYHHVSEGSCTEGSNKPTFMNIMWATTSEELLSAFRARAEHLQTLIDKL